MYVLKQTVQFSSILLDDNCPSNVLSPDGLSRIMILLKHLDIIF